MSDVMLVGWETTRLNCPRRFGGGEAEVVKSAALSTAENRMGDARVKGKERPVGTLSNDVIHCRSQPISISLIRPSQFLSVFPFPFQIIFTRPVPQYRRTVQYSIIPPLNNRTSLTCKKRYD
jgi:hypothetical protein